MPLKKNNGKTPNSQQVQAAEHELAQTALALVDNNWAKVLGETNQEAKEFLEANVDSIKNVTEIEKSNSADGLKNIAQNENNLDFYKENIHGSEQISINDVVNETIETGLQDLTKKAKTLYEQDTEETYKIVKENIKEYAQNTSYEEMKEDVKQAVENIVTDMQKGAAQLNDTVGLSTNDIAEVYNITQEEAVEVKNAIILIAGASMSGVVKDTVKGGIDLGVKKTDLNKGIYDSKNVKESLEDKYGAQNVAKVSKNETTGRTIIETTQGSKGGWNKVLNNPEANTDYKFNDSVYKTDDIGRVKEASFSPSANSADRNTHQQSKAGQTNGIKDGFSNDQGGHLNSAQTGGAGEQINYLPQDAQLNLSDWSVMENSWKKAAIEGKQVDVKIKPIYDGNSKRPSTFEVEYEIDGINDFKRFSNTPAGGGE